MRRFDPLPSFADASLIGDYWRTSAIPIAADAPAAADHSFVGHSRGPAYLAFTEAWERFSLRWRPPAGLGHRTKPLAR
jgi:hypothetical protein